MIYFVQMSLFQHSISFDNLMIILDRNTNELHEECSQSVNSILPVNANSTEIQLKTITI